MACMSRAGREPGFKKQNQDNCFAFEKYITAEQALFGAFDGHGPNGRRRTNVGCSHRAIMQCCASTAALSACVDPSLSGAGHLVSGYVKQHLPIMLVNHLSLENDTKVALQKGKEPNEHCCMAMSMH